MGGWVGRWEGANAYYRIAYSNKKQMNLRTLFTYELNLKQNMFDPVSKQNKLYLAKMIQCFENK